MSLTNPDHAPAPLSPFAGDAFAGNVHLGQAASEFRQIKSSPVKVNPCGVPGLWEGRVEWLVLLLLIAAQLAVIWSFKFFPTTDGPSHVANADVIRSYFAPGGHAYRTYYELQIKPMSNMLGHYVLALLLLFVSPLTAEKILVTLYVIALPMAARYSFEAIRRGSGFLAIAALPIAYGYLFHQGFYNFCLSTIFFFLTIGYWFSNRERFTLGRAVLFTLLGLLTFFCHIFALAMVCGVIAAMSGCFLLDDLRRRWNGLIPKGAVWRGFVSRSLTPLYALLPPLLLASAFRAGRPISGGTHLAGWRQATVWKHFLTIFDVVAYSRWEVWGGIALATLLAISSIWLIVRRLACRMRSIASHHDVTASDCDRAIIHTSDGLLLTALALAALYFKFSNETAQSFFIPERLMLFAVFVVLMWLAANRLAAWSRRILWIGGGVIVIALLAMRLPAYEFYNQQIAQLTTTVEPIRNGSTVLYLGFSARGIPQPANFTDKSVAPFYMPAGYFSPGKHIVDLRNYEAAEQYFPVQFRPGVDPFATFHTIGDEILPADLDILKAQTKMPTPIDYVLIWGMAPGDRTNPAVQKLYDQLRAGFVQINAASGGATELWERLGRGAVGYPGH